MKVAHTHQIGVYRVKISISSVMTAFWHLSVKQSNKDFNTLTNLFSKMAQYTEVISVKVSDTVLVLKYGLTVLSMKVSGETTKLMARVSSGTQMEMSTKVNGKMIRPTGTVSTFMLTEPVMKVTGRTICKTVPV